MYKDSKKISSEFKQGKHPYPGTIPVDKESFVKWAYHFFGLYSNNDTLFGYGGYYGYQNRVAAYNSEHMAAGRNMNELRSYGVGMQSPNKYRRFIKGKDPKTQKKIVNISYDPPKIMAKFRDQVIGKLSDYKFSPQPIAVDQDANKAREEMIGKHKMMLDPRMQQIQQSIGRKPTDAPNIEGMGLEKKEDIDTLQQLGGLPLMAEIMAKDAIDSVLEYSKYSDNLETMLDEDLFDIGVCAVEMIPKAGGEFCAKYVDVERLIARPSKYKDFRDIDFAGYVRDMSISELREESNLDEKDLYLIAKSYASFGNNARIHSQYAANFSSRSWREDFKTRHGSFPYDSYRISVFKFYFKAQKADLYKIGETPFGATLKEFQGTNLDLEGDSYIKEVSNTVYECKWIVGTKEVFDYGICKYTDNKTIPLRIWSIGTTSFVERSIAYVDDITVAILKERNTVSKMVPGPRMVLDTALLQQTVKIGAHEYNMLDLMEIFGNTGILTIRSKAEFQAMGQTASNRPPIQFLETGVLEDLRILMEYVRGKIDSIRNDTGFNEFFDGTTQNDRMLKPMIAGLNTAANNSLRNMVIGKYQIFKAISESGLHYWRLEVLRGPVELPVQVGHGFKLKELNKLIFKHSYMLKIVAKPTEEKKQLLYADVQQKEQNGLLSAEDKFFIMQVIEEGDLRKAHFYIAKAINSREKRAHAKRIDEIRAQSEANAESAKAAEAAKAESMTLEYKLKIQYLEKEIELQNMLNEEDHLRTMKEIAQKTNLDTAGKAIIEGTKVGHTQSLNS